ncbi:CHAT domain-containing protein [Okeania sp.]|uniref:CHAT domain-containing protein n=1 Tax=Okeania sp. TaxID=3100323 RepID=UPI002B4B26A1|nr:CHAT domain-containing protein [Okeania sp.]MEB3343263.1 CHAT domain-containing protein [Okeania sp.]
MLKESLHDIFLPIAIILKPSLLQDRFLAVDLNFKNLKASSETREKLPDHLKSQLDFLVEILQRILESRGDVRGDQSVKVLLQELDDDFIDTLKIWATSVFSEVKPEAKPETAERIAEAIWEFSFHIMKFTRGNRAVNVEIAIAGYHIAETILTRKRYPEKWAKIKHNFGMAYRNRIRGNKAENIEFAIAAYEQALQVRTKNKFPKQWAMTKNNLGVAYSRRIRGNKAKNIEFAINLHQEALQVYTKTKFRIEWASTQNNLGSAYKKRIRGDKAENIESAISAYKKALQVRTKTQYPHPWAETQNNLGNAYTDRIKGDKAENIEFAIAAYGQALQVNDKIDFPYNWAETQNNLGSAYTDRIKGNKSENIESAIVAYEQALQVFTENSFPDNWASTQNNLGIAYSHRIIGEKAENIESAIAAYEQALHVHTQNNFPYDWASTQNNIGTAYAKRIKEDKAENIEFAIAAYEQALQIYTKNNFPYDWARIQNNISTAYRDRIKGDKAENIEFAIASLQKALQIYTIEANPSNHFITAYTLGDLYFDKGNWQLATENYETAMIAAEISRSWVNTDERRQEIMEGAMEVYENQVQAYINLGQVDKAIEIVERSKTRNLVERLARSDLYPKGNIPQEIITQLDSLRRNITSLEKRLQIDRKQLSGNEFQLLNRQRRASENSEKRLQQELQESQQQLNEVLDQIQRIDPSFNLTQRVELISYRDIQNLIDEQTVIIQWYLVKDKILTFIVTNNGVQPIVQESSAEELKSLIDWAGDYLDGYRRQKKQWRNNLASSLKDLADILEIDRLLTTIDNIFDKQGIKCNRLILIPHRYLHLFPLHAMPLANGDLLIERFSGGVSYAPSNQLLQLTQKRERPYFSQLFAVQNPTEDLIYADIEVQAILSNFDSVDVLVGKDAKKAKVKTNSHLQSSHCIHFSCHGNFNLGIANASALSLAKDDVQKDGRLTLAEIFGFNLNQCRLATLSACETGLIDLTSWSDEYIGLPSAFLYAGASNVVSSLWSVNQVSAAFLLIKFYQNLKSGLTVAMALKQAQLWLRDVTVAELQKWTSKLKLEEELAQRIQGYLYFLPSDRQLYQDPYHWAAFCTVGK